MRIASKDCRNLVYQAYVSHFKNNEASSEWLLYVKKLLDLHGFSYVWDNPQLFNNNTFIDLFTRRVLDNFCQTWNSDISSFSKLDSYKCLKGSFEKEKYLDILENRKLRNAFCRLRISSHPLKIEAGRYNKPKPIPREERICTLCNVLDDEPHFLISCKKYDSKRAEMLTKLKKGIIVKYFENKNEKDKYIYLLTNKNPSIIEPVASFIYECLFKR